MNIHVLTTFLGFFFKYGVYESTNYLNKYEIFEYTEDFFFSLPSRNVNKNLNLMNRYSEVQDISKKVISTANIEYYNSYNLMKLHYQSENKLIYDFVYFVFSFLNTKILPELKNLNNPYILYNDNISYFRNLKNLNEVIDHKISIIDSIKFKCFFLETFIEESTFLDPEHQIFYSKKLNALQTDCLLRKQQLNTIKFSNQIKKPNNFYFYF